MLGLQIFRDSTLASLLADLTVRSAAPYGGGLRFGSNQHGYAQLDAPFIPMRDVDAFKVYDWPATAHAVVSNTAGQAIYEGRVEAKQILDGGVRLTAFGYWRALSDAPYTGLWSVDTSADWRPVPNGSLTNRNSSRFTFDNNNRLFVATQKNSVYSASMAGAQIYYAPDGGERDFSEVVFSYDFNMSASWTARMVSATADLSGTSTEWSLVGTGATQTGTITQAITANRQAIMFEIANTSGGSVTETAETGDKYLKITGMRLKSHSGSILASDIVVDMVGFVNGVNSTQLDDATVLIHATTTDLHHVLYHDVYPAAALDELAGLSGFEVGVWAGRQVHFRELDSEIHTMYIDVSRLEIEQDVDTVRNDVYGVYRDANGRLLRTASNNNGGNVTRLGIYRRAAASVNTANQTEAEAGRDVVLAARGDYTVRANVEFDRIFNENGAAFPLGEVRSGWTVIMRNLPPTLTPGIDNIRSFRVRAAVYDAGRNTLSVEPEVPVPTLVTLTAGV